jgi:hypothetical protein
MLRVAEDLGRRPHLYNLSKIHHSNALAHVADRAQVMADKQIRKSKP